MNTRSGRHTLRVVIAGGGTGGHLFPGIAVAEEFCARNPENRILFVGPGRPFEVSTVSEKGFAHRRITAEGLKGREIKNQIVAMVKIPVGVMQSVSILKTFKPHLVMGVGGYSAGPLVIGAGFCGLRLFCTSKIYSRGSQTECFFGLRIEYISRFRKRNSMGQSKKCDSPAIRSEKRSFKAQNNNTTPGLEHCGWKTFFRS